LEVMGWFINSDQSGWLLLHVRFCVPTCQQKPGVFRVQDTISMTSSVKLAPMKDILLVMPPAMQASFILPHQGLRNSLLDT
jgi:hypothetical protein